MPNIANAITNTISISLFDRGLARKIFEEVKQSGAKVVLKNNIAECVLLSPDEYVRLVDEAEDAKLLASATERLAHFDPATALSEEEVYAHLGICPEDIEDWEEVEIE